MTEKLCIYCHIVMLEGFDETERKYYEKGTRTLHTRDRCDAAKVKAGTHSTQQTNSKDQLAELVTKVDQLVQAVNELNQRLSGQSSLDVEQ